MADGGGVSVAVGGIEVIVEVEGMMAVGVGREAGVEHEATKIASARMNLFFPVVARK